MSAYSGITDALVSGIVAQQDPMNGLVRQLATNSVENGQVDLAVKKSEAVEAIEAKLTAAIARNADQVVVTTYQKLLNSLNS